jgi:4-amino-4-deoxychorismate synthase (2-amino-4-deoxychorismate-forming) component I
VAPTVRSFSAGFDPLGLIARYPDVYPGLLESSAPLGAAAGGGRFDILPISCGDVLRLSGTHRLEGPHAEGASGFLDALERWWSASRLDGETARLPGEFDPLPFTGGWLVYLGYELASEIEPRLVLPPCPDATAALAIRVPAAFVRDRQTGRAWLTAERGYEELLGRFEADAGRVATAAPAWPGLIHMEEEDPARFEAAVRRALEYIAAGDIYQANLSRRWQGNTREPVAPAALYRRLRAANPSPFAALLCDGDFAVISSSPERLLSVQGGKVSTRPIAGTRPRGSSPAEDAALVRSLIDNEKERAEHVMLIDLERNDLGRVCVGGSVVVDEYMAVETYAHVHHIVSNVSGRKLDDVSPIGVIRAMFPGGTITGCPKVRCMQIIAELEGAGRGAYTGSIGYLNRDGSCDFNILIRTMTAQVTAVSFSAGAGIVADSKPEQELAETRAKAEGLKRALT